MYRENTTRYSSIRTNEPAEALARNVGHRESDDDTVFYVDWGEGVWKGGGGRGQSGPTCSPPHEHDAVPVQNLAGLGLGQGIAQEHAAEAGGGGVRLRQGGKLWQNCNGACNALEAPVNATSER